MFAFTLLECVCSKTSFLGSESPANGQTLLYTHTLFPIYTLVVSGTTSQSIPMGPLGEIYEVPQEREGEGIYDLAQNGGETSPSAAYSKFDNILYETN